MHVCYNYALAEKYKYTNFFPVMRALNSPDFPRGTLTKG